MKTLTQHILEASQNAIVIDGKECPVDRLIKSPRITYDTIEEMPTKEWISQGVKYVLAFPPHEGDGGKADYFDVKMFIKSKRVADGFRTGERQALINLKTLQIENLDKIPMQAPSWKLIRTE